MPVKKMKIIMIVFCLLSGGFSIYLIGHAIMGKTSNEINVDPVDIPGNYDKTGENLSEQVVDSTTFQEIQEFKKSVYYDSVITIRPGLADSIKMLEEIYHSQK